MSKSPYREPGEPFPRANPPRALEAFEYFYSSKPFRLSTAEIINKSMRSGTRVYDIHCKKCGYNTLDLVAFKICRGKRVGVCRKVVCGETRDHFHIKCDVCDHSFLMATRDTEEST